jgi:hypothetical protein
MPGIAAELAWVRDREFPLYMAIARSNRRPFRGLYMAAGAAIGVHSDFSWWLTGPCPHVKTQQWTSIAGNILVS